MPKRPNNRPWPQNLFYDFGLSAISPADADAFITGLATSERNRTFCDCGTERARLPRKSLLPMT